MSEHLVDVEQVRAFQATEMPRVEKTIATARAKADAKKVLNAMQRREELLGLVATYRRLKAEPGLMALLYQIALAALLADEHPDEGAHEGSKVRPDIQIG